jgi:amidase
MTELAYRSTTELARMIRDREISAEDLLEHFLDRLERHNPALNAVVVTDLDAARRRAREADAALAGGESWGPLHGVPMTVKETYEVAGMPTTAGARELRDHRSAVNAVAVQRLLDAGAVIYGKTNVPLYASDLQSYNDIYGTTNNPWDPQRTPAPPA